MAKRKVSGVEVTADRIIVKLIDMLLAQDRSIDALRKELNEHFNMIAELQPKLLPNGQVKLRAMTSGDDARETDVYVGTEPFAKETHHGDEPK